MGNKVDTIEKKYDNLPDANFNGKSNAKEAYPFFLDRVRIPKEKSKVWKILQEKMKDASFEELAEFAEEQKIIHFND